MTDFSSNEFRALKKAWDQKLKDSGFEDIEDAHPQEPKLKDWDSFYYQCRYHPTTFLFQQEYYFKATHWLETYSFSTKVEKKIWEHHSNGLTLRRIAKELRLTTYQVHKTIRQISQIMLQSQGSNQGWEQRQKPCQKKKWKDPWIQLSFYFVQDEKTISLSSLKLGLMGFIMETQG